MARPAVLAPTTATPPGTDVRPRVVVTTDPELDDLNSLLRLLLYANELRLVGLVYASSQFHYAGLPAAGIAPHRWPPAGERLHIHEAVDRYAQVYDNLRRHAEGYPAPEELRALIAEGNTAVLGDYRTDSDGSHLIQRVLLDGVAGQVFVGCWGGPSTVAAALRSIEEDHAREPYWPDLQAAITRKLVITSFAKQDPSFDEYIRPAWPQVELREVATTTWGYFARRTVLPEHARYLSAEWMRTHVSEQGPIGESYRVWGDGKQMAPGDVEDYFGLSGLTAEELEARGYRVWIDPQEPGSWISEGDSSNFALLLDNGLRSWQHPSWGGWGGRQARTQDPYTWSNEGVLDEGPDGQPREDYATARWFEDIQLDFAARLRWSVTPGPANHAPVATVADLDRTARPGEVVELRGTATDPDGDAVDAWWWVYREAGTYPGRVAVARAGESWTLTVPADARPGQTIHAIFQVRDHGTPPMTAYQRVVVTVA